MEILLRTHVDDKPARYTQTKDERPDPALFLPLDRPTDEAVKIIMAECYRGVNHYSRFDNPRHYEGYWWRYFRQTSILVAYDLPAEIAKLGYCERESKAGGFVYV